MSLIKSIINSIVLVPCLCLISDNNSSPFNINVSAKFYDVTDMFYQLCSIDRSLLVASMTFDPENYPGNLLDSGGTNVKLAGPRTEIVKDYFAYNNQDHTITMNKTTLQADQAMFGPDKLTGKLFLCDLIVNKNDFNFAEYTNEALEWTFFERYTGKYLRNDDSNISFLMGLDISPDVNKAAKRYYLKNNTPKAIFMQYDTSMSISDGIGCVGEHKDRNKLMIDILYDRQKSLPKELRPLTAKYKGLCKKGFE